MGRPRPQPPGPGQESVWDYPRPPAVVDSDERVVVRFAGRVLADTRSALRVLETSHAPVYYLPPDDVDRGALVESSHVTWCEFKGRAVYHDIQIGGRRSRRAVWRYPDPAGGYERLRDHLAFYPERVDEILVDGEQVRPVEGSFYGGWVTSRVVGPFKGGYGTQGW